MGKIVAFREDGNWRIEIEVRYSARIGKYYMIRSLRRDLQGDAYEQRWRSQNSIIVHGPEIGWLADQLQQLTGE